MTLDSTLKSSYKYKDSLQLQNILGLDQCDHTNNNMTWVGVTELGVETMQDLVLSMNQHFGLSLDKCLSKWFVLKCK